jgi:hypothetical protein
MDLRFYFAEAAEATASRDRAWRYVHEARTERDALRAVIEGRTTPPTDEEVAAHAAAGGQWRTLGLRGFGLSGDVLDGDASRAIRAVSERSRVPRRWWALDAEGRPCGWPPTGDSK